MKKLGDARPNGENLLRLPEVIARIGRSKAGIYVLIREGTFPAPLRVGKRAVAWKSSEIDAWIGARVVCAYAPAPEART